MERYKSIIDDWQSFKEECQKEARPALRKNSLKSRKNFEEALKKDFPEASQSSWNEKIYTIPREKSPGKSFLHWRGEYYVQEESASLPVEALDPRPGEKVLDMCAAPGGKTTQIAAEMDNRGLVVSNDDSSRRLKSLHANVYRTGSAIVNVTNYDGRRIPGTEKFDRVLVDAPCSGEGNNARRSFEASDKEERSHLSDLQFQLLEKAVQIVKEDGVIVYSTCTFAPEENEAVISKALEEFDLELERIETDVEHRRGVESFEEKVFGPEISKTVRIYPHHINSGGIFVARLRK